MNFAPFSSRAVRIPRKDIDTDIIIPASFLKTTDKSGLAKGCFFELKKDPHFPMNTTEFSEAHILIVGANFGCGSSREHAPWALKQSGFSVIISSEFADIFRGNAGKNGLLLVQLSESEMAKLFATDEFSAITIDLPRQKIMDESGKEYPFEISSFVKKRLLENISEIDFLSHFSEKISAFEKKRLDAIALL